MKVNENINANTYNVLQKNNTNTNNEPSNESRIKESFDLSILHENRAQTYNTQDAQAVLKNVNYAQEIQTFSKENLEGFSQSLTQAQAHLSSTTVNQLLK